MRLRRPHRIVAGVEELDFRAEQLRRALRLVAPAGLDLLQRRARLLPGELAFAALAERQAGDLYAIALFGVQRDGAARAPDEIAGMRRDHKAGLAHEFLLLIIALRFPRARSPRPICRYRPSAAPGFPRANWPWPRSRVRARAFSGQADRAPRAAPR